MLLIINALLDLWDPYEIYLFPQDEYTSYAIKIHEFIEKHKDINIETLTNFVFEILPPIIKDNDNIIVSKVEYERFAKTLLLILQV